jgi:hypothetical protein
MPEKGVHTKFATPHTPFFSCLSARGVLDILFASDFSCNSRSRYGDVRSNSILSHRLVKLTAEDFGLSEAEFRAVQQARLEMTDEDHMPTVLLALALVALCLALTPFADAP